MTLATVRHQLGAVYDAHLRERLPRRPGEVTGGVEVADARRLLDLSHPGRGHEPALCDAISTTIEAGDRVLIFGGCTRFSSLPASRGAGEAGLVDAFEPVTAQRQRLKDTIERNDTPATIRPHADHIGDVTEWSEAHFGAIPEWSRPLRPSAIPERDVAVLDCEGAEVEAIPLLCDAHDLAWPPAERVVVETHGFIRDAASSAAVREQLDELGYQVGHHGTEDAERDIEILVGVRQ